MFCKDISSFSFILGGAYDRRVDFKGFSWTWIISETLPLIHQPLTRATRNYHFNPSLFVSMVFFSTFQLLSSSSIIFSSFRSWNLDFDCNSDFQQALFWFHHFSWSHLFSISFNHLAILGLNQIILIFISFMFALLSAVSPWFQSILRFMSEAIYI